MFELLAKESDVAHFKKKQVIYSEGNHALRLYYVNKGKVKTYKTNEDGKEFITAIHNEGDFFGYIPILERTVHKETAETLEDCEVAVIPKDSFEELIYTNPAALKKLVELLAKNVAEKEEQLLRMAYNSLRQKVANAVLIVHKKYNAGGKVQKAIDISRDNLATIAGTAKESMIRTLSDFKEEKLIDIVKADIIILNEAKLQQIAN
jgi:CRP/FNR family cyclic AMP-dependent transcriptional regulator